MKEGKMFIAKLVSRKQVSEETHMLEFMVVDDMFAFHPGQYVWVKVRELLYPDPRGEQRAFTIASCPGKSTFTIIFRSSLSGFKKTLLEMPIDTLVDIFGPCGSFCAYTPKSNEKMTLVAGGVGVAPFLSILEHCLTGVDSPRAHLIYCESSESRIIPEVIALQKKSLQTKNLQVSIHIGAIEEGFVQLYNTFGRDSTWYLSGPMGMIRVLSTQLLSVGITKNQMRFEENYPYFPYERELTLPVGNESSEKNIYKLALDDALTHTVITDINGRVLYANNATSQRTGFSHGEILGNTPRLWGGLMDKTFYEEMWRMIKNDRLPFIGKVTNRKKSGEAYTAEISIVPILELNGDLVGFYASEKNITELERIDKAKTEFVSLVSHQLRTPLSSVNWFSEMLLTGDAGELNSEQRKYLEEIYSGNQRMVELVNDLLDVSRLDLGTFIINLVQTDIIVLIEDVVLEQQSQIDEKKIQLHRIFSENIPQMAIDLKLMRMVLQNLLSNAIKYSPENSTIDFSVNVPDGKNILIIIKDSGCGIPEHQQKDIFSKLFRADNVKQMDVEGTGLGLYITRSIIESSGGKIWFESRENMGTTFFVTFPLDGMKKLEHGKSPF